MYAAVLAMALVGQVDLEDSGVAWERQERARERAAQKANARQMRMLWAQDERARRVQRIAVRRSTYKPTITDTFHYVCSGLAMYKTNVIYYYPPGYRHYRYAYPGGYYYH